MLWVLMTEFTKSSKTFALTALFFHLEGRSAVTITDTKEGASFFVGKVSGH